jgi:hypothetical protein
VGVSEAQIKSAQAGVAQREAALAQARIDLARTRITSPVNGIVIKRAIEKGQTVAASLQSPELFVIAQNLQDMQVDASIDESDVGRIRTGQKATFTVDAFPGQTFEGTVRQVRKAAQNVANVVTYVAVVGFSNTGGRLLPGMTANVRLITDQRESVLKVPNAALRVRIAGVEPAATGPGCGVGGQTSVAGTTTGGWRWMSGGQCPACRPRRCRGGGFAAMRERLVTELKLSPEQRQAGRHQPPTCARSSWRCATCPKTSARRARKAAGRDARPHQRHAGRGPARANTPRCKRRPRPAPATPGPARPQVLQILAPQPHRALQPKKEQSPAPATGRTATGAGHAAMRNRQLRRGGTHRPGGAAITGQGPLVETRNRLVAELRMDAAQAAKLDAIYAAARPRFMALRDLPAEERGKARERISGDMRARSAHPVARAEAALRRHHRREARAARPRAAASTCWARTASPAPTTCAWASATAP